MKADDIRSLNEKMQENILNARSVGEQEAGFKSLFLSLLSELTAITAEINKKWDMILNPPLMVKYDKTKIDLADWNESPQPIMMVNEPRPTLRDQFAMAALQGVFSGNSDEFWVDVSLDVLKTTSQAYKWADKMMEERNK